MTTKRGPDPQQISYHFVRTSTKHARKIGVYRHDNVDYCSLPELVRLFPNGVAIDRIFRTPIDKSPILSEKAKILCVPRQTGARHVWCIPVALLSYLYQKAFDHFKDKVWRGISEVTVGDLGLISRTLQDKDLSSDPTPFRSPFKLPDRFEIVTSIGETNELYAYRLRIREPLFEKQTETAKIDEPRPNLKADTTDEPELKNSAVSGSNSVDDESVTVEHPDEIFYVGDVLKIPVARYGDNFFISCRFMVNYCQVDDQRFAQLFADGKFGNVVQVVWFGRKYLTSDIAEHGVKHTEIKEFLGVLFHGLDVSDKAHRFEAVVLPMIVGKIDKKIRRRKKLEEKNEPKKGDFDLPPPPPLPRNDSVLPYDFDALTMVDRTYFARCCLELYDRLEKTEELRTKALFALSLAYQAITKTPLSTGLTAMRYLEEKDTVIPKYLPRAAANFGANLKRFFRKRGITEGIQNARQPAKSESGVDVEENVYPYHLRPFFDEVYDLGMRKDRFRAIIKPRALAEYDNKRKEKEP